MPPEVLLAQMQKDLFQPGTGIRYKYKYADDKQANVNANVNADYED